MDTYIVRQPVTDKNKKVFAYELIYKEDSSSLYNRDDMRVANAIENFLTDLGNDKLLADKPAFLSFTPNLLLKEIPHMFDPSRLIIQIDDSCLVHPKSLSAVYGYKNQGYRIAIKGFEFSPRFFGVLDAVDIVKVDMESAEESPEKVVGIVKNLGKEVCIYNINTPEALEAALASGCDYMQGTQVAGRTTSKLYSAEHLQSNFFRLMVAVTKDEPDVEEISKIISRDVTLTVSLLKLVNSAYFALRNRVSSVLQALVILGIGQLKQWIYLLSFKTDTSSDDELIKISFLRGTFCEALLEHVKNMPISANEAYFMGMFSTLEMLMGIPLEKALDELPISEEVKNALTTGEGRCAELFKLVISYEQADWAGITEYSGRLGIPADVITRTYFECVEEVGSIWESLHAPAEGKL